MQALFFLDLFKVSQRNCQRQQLSRCTQQPSREDPLLCNSWDNAVGWHFSVVHERNKTMTKHHHQEEPPWTKIKTATKRSDSQNWNETDLTCQIFTVPPAPPDTRTSDVSTTPFPSSSPPPLLPPRGGRGAPTKPTGNERGRAADGLLGLLMIIRRCSEGRGVISPGCRFPMSESPGKRDPARTNRAHLTGGEAT